MRFFIAGLSALFTLISIISIPIVVLLCVWDVLKSDFGMKLGLTFMTIGFICTLIFILVEDIQ